MTTLQKFRTELKRFMKKRQFAQRWCQSECSNATMVAEFDVAQQTRRAVGEVWMRATWCSGDRSSDRSSPRPSINTPRPGKFDMPLWPNESNLPQTDDRARRRLAPHLSTVLYCTNETSLGLSNRIAGDDPFLKRKTARDRRKNTRLNRRKPQMSL